MHRLVLFLISSTLILVLAGSALATIDSPRPIVAQPYQASSISTEIPDLVVSVRSSTSVIERGRVVQGIRELPGVEEASVVVDDAVGGDGAIAILVVLSEGSSQAVVESVSASVYQTLGDARVSVGGRAVADRAILDRLNRGTIIAIAPVIMLVAVLVAAAYGLATGLSVGATIGLSTLLGSLVAAKMTGDFDGTIATTAVPAALVAVLVSSVLTFRLIEWFKHPLGEDPAATIRQAVRGLAPEAGLVVGGLFVASILLALSGSGVTATLVVAISAATSCLVTLATMPAMLASSNTVPDNDDYRMFRMDVPDGRDFPLAMLAGFACLLLGFGLFAVQTPGDSFLDESAMSANSSARRSLGIDALDGTDPTSAVLAELPPSATSDEVARWSQTASAIASVAFVDSEEGRFVDGKITGIEPAPVGGARALIHLEVSARSELAQRAVGLIESIQVLPAQVELSGTPVDSAQTADGATTSLWILVGLLSVTGAMALFLITHNPGLALVGFFARVLGTAATIGIYFVVASSPTAFELQVAALIASTGVGLFEVGLIRRLVTSPLTKSDPGSALTAAMRFQGRPAMIGMGITALSGVGFLATDLDVARRLGVALAVGLVIELILGVWLLRPVLLGETLVRADAAPRPITVVATPPAEPEGLSIGIGDLSWKRVVSGLLRSEFAFQQDPTRAQLDEVFVEGTAVHSELSSHNALLRSNGLRVVGRGPKVLKVSVIEAGSPVCLAITVDHPPRQLVDHTGKIVGERTAERRGGMLWLMRSGSGRHRIAEAVDLGAVAEDSLASTSSVPLAVGV